MSPDVSLTTTDNPMVIVGVAVLLFVVGAGVAAYGVSEYRTQSEVLDDVVEVEATITDVELEAYDNGMEANVRGDDWDQREDEVTWHLFVEFEYEYEGDVYRSTNHDAVGAVPTYSDWDDARDARDKFAVGDRVTAYVPPDDPGEAFLDGDMPTAVYAAMGFGAILLLGAVWLPIAYRLGIGRN